MTRAGEGQRLGFKVEVQVGSDLHPNHRDEGCKMVVGKAGTIQVGTPQAYPLVILGDLPAVLEQMHRGQGYPRYAVLMFVAKDSIDGEHVNLRYSLIDGVFGLDWVLLGGRNRTDSMALAVNKSLTGP
jgi:hypothetical protein